MTGRKSGKGTRKRAAKQQPQQQFQQQTAAPSVSASTLDDPIPNGIRKEQPPQQQVVKKILKAEIDEARTLKTVFKSNPDSQMKDFIKKSVKSCPQTAKQLPKTPAETHPPAVAQDLLDIDDDVADNLGKLFKTCK